MRFRHEKMPREETGSALGPASSLALQIQTRFQAFTRVLYFISSPASASSLFGSYKLEASMPNLPILRFLRLNYTVALF